MHMPGLMQGATRVTLMDVISAGQAADSNDLRSPCCTAAVEMLRADVGSAVGAAILASKGPVDGVLHAAGVLRDALLLKQTAASFRAVLAGKVCIRGYGSMPALAKDQSVFLPSHQHGWYRSRLQLRIAFKNGWK